MDHGKFAMVALCLIFILGIAAGQENATATFNMLGVTGYVAFTTSGQDTEVLMNLSLPSTSYTWEIREFPVVVAQNDPCNDSVIGNVLHDVTDQITSDNETSTLTGVSLLVGNNAIMGRTLLLRNDQERVCASILPVNHQVSYAVVNGPVAGYIHVHKVGARYAMLTDLFSTQSLENDSYSVMVYSGSVSADLPNSVDTPSSDKRCDLVAGETLLGEVSDVPVAGAGTRVRSWNYITPNELQFDFTGGHMKIQKEAETSCANIHVYQTKSVRAIFSMDGVSGNIKFSQSNPYASTMMSVSLSGLAKSAGGYHVHQYPIGYRYSSESELCAGVNTGAHFAPLPFSSGSTQDYAEIGDLSTKHGSLADADNITTSYEDWYLPLFGEYSIIGRSVVIHRNEGSRWVCANIGYPGPVVTAVAQFNFYAKGTITFIQEKDKPWSDTTVFVKIANAGFDQAETEDHKYHVHTAPVSGDADLDTSRCSSTEGHWNPYDVNVQDGDVYKAACSASNLGCETGDLNGKFGKIKLAGKDSYNSYLYTNDIPLSGAYNVIGKSITIHEKDAGGSRYACADIKEKLHVVASLPSYEDGTVVFRNSEIVGATELKVDLNNLNSNAGAYHVHVLPLDPTNPGDNICGTTAGHYNPFEASTWKDQDTLDRYEVGDISAKFGALNELPIYTLQTVDTNLPIEGYRSIVGRSVVIHDSSGGRWKCYNIEHDTKEMGGTLIQAMATFKGEVDGRMIFSQVINDFGNSDVVIDIMLSYKDGRKATAEHKWHVHTKTYDGESCASTGGHYNPYGADISSALYSEQCGQTSPQKCEMGDQSSKLGTLKVGDGYRAVLTDNFLTLVGRDSVMGRSIVIHGAELDGARLDCADIVPFGNLSKTLEFNIKKQKDNTYRADMASIIAHYLKAAPESVYVADQQEQSDGCTAVRVYLSGPKAADMLKKFDTLFLGDYAEVEKCELGSGEKGKGNQLISLHIIWLFLLSMTAILLIPH